MFYLTLPSNSSLNFYPENTPSHYFTRLPQSIDMSGDYEVGLCEILLSNTYLNIREGDCVLSYLEPDEEENENKPDYDHREIEKLVVPEGLYESNEIFIYTLNVLIKQLSKKTGEKLLKFYYNKSTKKATLSVYKKGAMLSLSPTLRRILSLRENHTPPLGDMFGQGRYTGEFNMDLNEDFKSVYVYCDLVSPRQVGDTTAPLLRICPIQNKSKEMTHLIFEKPHYVPLSRLQFNTAEVLLTNDKGKPIAFTSGTSIVTLHFRRRRPEYY